MNKAVLGIDLGTSSVKVMLKYQNGEISKEKEIYDEISPKGWIEAIRKAVERIKTNDISAVGLSSQVGTYITDNGNVISWNDDIGKEELESLKKKYSKQDFLKEISMMHPDIISYPIPRLIYIQKHFAGTKMVCQPKDYICEALTGNLVTDQYSWRGLADIQNKVFSERILSELGLSNIKLPRITNFLSNVGLTSGCKILPDGIPVYVGLNDYYASLIGMGISKSGDMFDITGTSEHFGIIENDIKLDTDMVSSPYLYKNVHYGVTASSGSSIDFGMNLSDKIDINKSLSKNPPIFLPYLNGERAPIWDSGARGMFWGIDSKTDKSDLAYSVFEGVVFSIYHIYEHMGKPSGNSIRVSGGAAKSMVLNVLKAEIFNTSVITQEENDTSALGACMVAAMGEKWYDSIEETIENCCKEKDIIKPNGDLRNILKNRFEIYKKIYPAIKDIK